MSQKDSARVFLLLGEVARELDRQDVKWGEQNHRDGTGLDTPVLKGIGDRAVGWNMQRIPALRLANFAKDYNDAVTGGGDTFTKAGTICWADILLEELFEALAEEPGSRELRTELIQVAAVAVQWVAALDRAPAATGSELANRLGLRMIEDTRLDDDGQRLLEVRPNELDDPAVH